MKPHLESYIRFAYNQNDHSKGTRAWHGYCTYCDKLAVSSWRLKYRARGRYLPATCKDHDITMWNAIHAHLREQARGVQLHMV